MFAIVRTALAESCIEAVASTGMKRTLRIQAGRGAHVGVHLPGIEVSLGLSHDRVSCSRDLAQHLIALVRQRQVEAFYM